MDISGSSIFSFICIAGFTGFLVVAIIAAVIYSAKRGKEAALLAQQLGFTPLKQADPALLTRLKAVYQPTPLVRVTNLATKAYPEGQLYLFDAMTASQDGQRRNSGDSGNSEYRTIAILSNQMDLPPFFLIRRMPTIGPLGDGLNDLIAAGMERAGFGEWTDVPPDFSRLYRLYTRSDTRFARIFTDDVFSRIAQVPDLVVRGEGNTLLYNSYDARRGVKLDATALANHIQQARQLSTELSG